MTKKLFSLVAALGILLASSPAFASRLDFSIFNHTGLTIKEVYVSEANDTNWGEDILEKDVLADGEEFEIDMSDFGKKAKHFDIKLVDKDRNEWIVEDVNLEAVHSIVVRKFLNKVWFEEKK
ncbi:hypothetical protein D3C87_816700 [compost metagenome]